MENNDHNHSYFTVHLLGTTYFKSISFNSTHITMRMVVIYQGLTKC